MPDDVFLQVQAIHTLLAPARPKVLAHAQRPSRWRWLARLPWLDIALFLSTATTYLLALRPASDSTLIVAATLVLLLFVARLLMYRLEYLRLSGAADSEAHAALMERSAYEARVARELQVFDLKALEYAVAEYDAQLEAVDRSAGTWLGPTRVGGVIGIIGLLLAAYPGLQKVTGGWTLLLLAVPFGLALGGLSGVNSFEGRRRARALLARAVALKRP
ncbi:hypothetical protein Dcar01_01799 [Deinococcus carri]|uniref:ABC transporter ATP-binding protein n=1 Tax=Deinococcus carri TaxID=1211323 RepID=A0ABP9W6S3_9DEIO